MKRGEVYYVDLNPVIGSEQGGERHYNKAKGVRNDGYINHPKRKQIPFVYWL